MSPVGGVGINLAIQDAVAAARYLASPLRRGAVSQGDLARVQIRRWAPTFVTQSLQRLVHRFVLQPVLTGELSRGGRRRDSRFAGPLRLIPRLQAILAYIVAIGVLPEHAPSFARRSSSPAAEAR
jgi:2-polyprenyl-6-methoxyphenol hydroxylase-like FAD-dependent oxidoreductase